MGAISGTLATANAPEVFENALRPEAVANAIRGSVLLVAGVVTDSEDAISLGKQIVSGSSEASSSSGPRQPSPEEVIEMREELERWKRELSRARAEPATSGPSFFVDELQKREAELKEIENKHRQLEEEIRKYPRPAYLEASVAKGCVNVAVVGNSGVGKSLLINSLRGVQSGDPTWAPVGVSQTTSEPVAYAMPGQADIQLWDLAGAGSQQFIPGGYTRTIGLRHFDVVLVVTACRFTQTEAVLLSELDRSSVPSFLVRTMVDVDISSNQADHGLSEEATKQGIVDDLRVRGVPHPYLVNARLPLELDFPRLLSDVLKVAADRHRKGDVAPAMKFHVGETAEVFSKHEHLWVKCAIEALSSRPDEYDISIRMPGPRQEKKALRVANVPARGLRKAQFFNAGDPAEIIILQGPNAGSWARCRISGEGDAPDMYHIHVPNVPDVPAGKLDLKNVHNSVLRKASAPEPSEPPIDVERLKEVLKAFKEVCSSNEFQATVASLQGMGLHNEEVQRMKRTLISHQLCPVLVRYNVAATGQGWAGFLAFLKAHGTDPEVVKLAHEVERMMKVGAGDIFGIQGDPFEESWSQRLKDTASGLLVHVAQRSRKAAEVQCASGAPTARDQRATAGHVDPMSRSMSSLASASRWMRSP